MLSPDDDITTPANEKRPWSGVNSAQWMLAGFLFTALVIGAILYKVLMRAGWGHTSLMFIGIPAVLALLLVLAPTPKSATGSILRGMTLALLLIAPLVGEGYLCILFSAPLFLIVGLVIGKLVDYSRARRASTLSCIAILVVPLALEGVVPGLTHSRVQSVTAVQIIPTPVGRVEAALAASPDLSQPLPQFLRIGFPRPLAARGSGLALNDSRTIHFGGAEGDPPGDLVMRVAAIEPGRVRFETISDTSKIAQWVHWRGSQVDYSAIDATHTRVAWTISFDRRLDPYWYFAPWEHLAARVAARYLITVNAANAAQKR
jgi:hypothetical protein